MSALFSGAFNSSLSSLRANQQAIAILSQNIANLNSVGYSRQQVIQSNQVINNVGQGVSTAVSRSADSFLINATRTQNSQVGQTAGINDYYQRLQLYYGQPGSGNSLNDSLSNFFTSMSALANAPEQSYNRNDALTQAVNLTNQISGLANNLETTRFQADQDIKSGVDFINQKLSDLKGINKSIQEAGTLGQGNSALLDQRDAALSDIAQWVDLTVNYQDDGQINLSTPSGVDLLSGNFYQLSYLPANAVGTFINDGSLSPVKVNLIKADGSIGSSETLVTGGPSSTVTTPLKAGRLAGLLQMRDHNIPDLLDQLDNLANVIVNQVNTIHNDGAGFPAPASLTGTRLTSSTQGFAMSGSVMVAVTGTDGKPVPSAYPDETYVPALKLDLSTLDSGNGYGKPTVQTIVDEINNYYGPPQRKVELGDMNNVKLAAISDAAVTGSDFTFDLDLSNLTANNATVDVTGIAVSGVGSTVVSGVPLSATIEAGEQARTGPKGGLLTVNFGGAGPWTISADVTVTDVVTGIAKTDTITYTITAAASGLMNDRYNVTSVSGAGDGNIVNATNTKPIAHAVIVDANGNSVAAGQDGYLKIVSDLPTYGVALAELDSQESGKLTAAGAVISGSATNLQFSDYFQLNDFFVRSSDYEVNNSAINMAVRADLKTNPNSISTGQLQLSKQPANSSFNPLYSYELSIGNNGAIQNLINLQNQSFAFAATSSLQPLNVKFSDYSTQMISYASGKIANATSNADQQKQLFDGLDKKREAVSGVNIDEEIANTMLFQNAYAASTKVISTVKDSFDALLAII